MLTYLARRFAASLLILLGVSVVTFGLTFMIPADPVAMIAGRNSTPDVREQIRRQLLSKKQEGDFTAWLKLVKTQATIKRGDTPTK